MPAEIIQFDEFELDLGRYQLRRGDRVVKLEKNPMELLILLLEKQGQLVTREEIIQRLWGDSVFVDTRHGINTAVHKLRTALRDDSEQPRILETVVGKGYRLVAGVAAISRVDQASLKNQADTVVGVLEPELTSTSRPLWQTVRLRTVARIVLTAGMVLALWFALHQVRDRLFGSRSAGASIQSLAVLPFENLSGDSSKEYFADGFTDELITDLAEQTKLRIVSRSSTERFKGSRKPLPEIAKELGVDAVVEGSVSIGDQRIRITAQLIDGASDRHLWAHSYERDRKDLFPIQSEVASTIASLIRTNTESGSASNLRASPANVRVAPLRPRFTPETYELSFECRNLAGDMTDADVNHMIQCYQRILSLDPNCAAAYAEIAGGYISLGLENQLRARDAAIKAVELDPTLPEAHLVLAEFRMAERDFAGAERELSQTLELEPSYGGAHQVYADLLLMTGRSADAIAEGARTKALDPFSGGIPFGTVLFMAGRYDEAIKEEKAALEFYPQSERALFILGYAYEQKRMYKDAIAVYRQRLAKDDHGIFLAALGRAQWLSGDTRGAADVKRKIEHFPPNDFVWPYDAALFYAALDDRDRAFEWLEKDFKEHDDWLLFLKVDPRAAALRADPRFQDLVRRVGLPLVAKN